MKTKYEAYKSYSINLKFLIILICKNSKNLSAWYDLFAELDPLKNPDAIGQKEGLEEERNC